jgi:hypothetical protein
MDEAQLDALVRRYANRELCWQDLRAAGVDSYLSVLAALDRQDLKYPIAAMTWPNVEVRRRGIDRLHRALSDREPPPPHQDERQASEPRVSQANASDGDEL